MSRSLMSLMTLTDSQDDSDRGEEGEEHAQCFIIASAFFPLEFETPIASAKWKRHSPSLSGLGSIQSVHP